MVSELSKVPDSLVSDGSQITFDPPTAAEASDGPRCRLNLYLHDVRENVQLRDQSWAVVRRSEEGSIRGRKRPPVRLDLSYLVTAHMADDPATEHRLLSETLGILLRLPYVPEEYLTGTLEGRGAEGVLLTVVQPDDVAHTDAHNLWRVLGGSLRPSISVVVTTEFDPFETTWTRVVREAVLGIGHGVPPRGPQRPLVMAGDTSTDWTVIGDAKELTIYGAHLGPWCYPKVIAYLRRGMLVTDGVVTHRMALDRFREAFDLVHHGGTAIKVLLIP